MTNITTEVAPKNDYRFKQTIATLEYNGFEWTWLARTGNGLYMRDLNDPDSDWIEYPWEDLKDAPPEFIHMVADLKANPETWSEL